MKRRAPEQLVRTAAWLGLLALLLMAVSVAVPRPLAVVAAMTVGQVLGTLSLALFGYAVLVDIGWIGDARGRDDGRGSRATRPQRSSTPPEAHGWPSGGAA